MPEFQLDTSGAVEGVPAVRGHPVAPAVDVRFHGHVKWSYLDAFTQGYVEALFFAHVKATVNAGRFSKVAEAEGVGFADLAPETLARIIADCAAFRDRAAYLAYRRACHGRRVTDDSLPTPEQAGRDFCYTRNGHGTGFWDGDWPEPHASALTDAAKAFGQVDAYLGDDGKVYLS